MKHILGNYFLSGTQNSKNPAFIKQVIVANYFSTIGYIITFILGIFSLIDQQWMHSFALLSMSFVFFVAYWLHKIKVIQNPHVIAENIMLITIMAMMLFLIHFGGVGNTGPLWIYIIPSVTLFFSGLQKGLITLSVFTVCIATMLFFPNDALLATTYSFEFKSRLMYSFLTVASLFVAYEYIRETSYQELESLKIEFELQAKHDMLSGLLNRRGMIENLQYEFKRNKRAKADISIMMCDIDNFKSINDQYGHEKGDEIIKSVARIFEENLREQDSLARWGGEEYLFLLPMTNADQSLILAEKLRLKVAAYPFEHEGSIFNITVSLGIHQHRNQEAINDMINKADNNLYKAKGLGRNRCVS